MDSCFLGTAPVETMRRPAFFEDDGLASLAEDMEAGFSGKSPFFSASAKRRASYRALPPARSGLVYEETQHFLDSCSLCKKPLGGNRDIFMYRGNTPFCSEACRQEQMDIDEAKEKKWNISVKTASRKEQQKSSNTSDAKNQDFPIRAGTVVAG